MNTINVSRKELFNEIKSKSFNDQVALTETLVKYILIKFHIDDYNNIASDQIKKCIQKLFLSPLIAKWDITKRRKKGKDVLESSNESWFNGNVNISYNLNNPVNKADGIYI